ncbi:TlpA family protein disulfide reductase [Sunxiuqinia sp. sy24]|uniref:TlpA family protein disulfide reductase n=1 Tax=Sunxiuqinia sp. sy24 TaxID=3461495 RepID=UPI0040461C31
MKRMLKRFTRLSSFFVLLGLAQVGYSQSFSLQLSFPDQPNDTVVLAHYYNGQIYANDTLMLNQHGQSIIHKNDLRPQGIYVLFFNSRKQIDFLLGEDQRMEISQQDETIQIKDAIESEWFQAYVDYLKARKKEAADIRKKLSEAGEHAELELQLKKQLSELDAEIQQKWQAEAEKGTGSFYGKFMTSNRQLLANKADFPPEVQSNDSLLWICSYQFNKRHYWDYFDWLDPRMWRTPTIHSKLETYFNKVLIQHPDSVLPAAIEMIEASKTEPEIFQNLVSFLLNNSIQSNYLGMENVFVALAEKYYLSGQAFWASEKTLKTIRREVYFRKNNLIGATAKELLLPDEEGQYHSLHQQSTTYTVVVFWEPECGHCKQQIPELFEEVFLKTDPSKLSVMAVYTQDNQEEWQHFIAEHELNGWLNLWDPDQLSNMQVNYNIRTTPMIYLLDRDKKIIAKKLTVDSLKKLLSNL